MSAITIPMITQAHRLQKDSSLNFKTKLQRSLKLSEKYGANVYLKREDQQQIRVFKMRGAFNSFMSLTPEQRAKGLVTVSDGNFAEAFAFFCNHFKIKGAVFLPEVCFQWKIDIIQKYGKEYVEIKSVGESFDEAEAAAKEYIKQHDRLMIHPCDNVKAIIGNATIGIEIIEDFPGEIDYVFVPIGAGALASGIATYFKAIAPHTKIIGVQPDGAASMKASFDAKKIVRLEEMSRFCDGSAVKTVPQITFDLCQKYLDDVVVVPEGKVSTTILELYNQGIAVEPAGALAVSVLEQYADQIKDKNVVCLISGGTVDLSRFDEFKEHSLLYEGLKYFFLIQIPFRPGILKNFVSLCLGPDDDISHIQFQKKTNRERGPCLVAIDVAKKENIQKVMQNMTKMHLQFEVVNDSKELFDLLV